MAQKDNRTEWIKARVRPDERIRIEGLAAGSDRTVSELIRDAVLQGTVHARGLSALERHDLSRIALALRQSNHQSPILLQLEALIERIDELE